MLDKVLNVYECSFLYYFDFFFLNKNISYVFNYHFMFSFSKPKLSFIIYYEKNVLKRLEVLLYSLKKYVKTLS